MKLTFILLVFSGLTLSATNSEGQNKRVSLTMEDANILDVFREIEESSDYGFFFKNDQLDMDDNISIEVEDAEIEEVLNQILKRKGYSYHLVGQNVVVTRSGSSAPEIPQENRTIVGKVEDTDGEPLPGVNIAEKGTSNGTISDGNGNYQITLEEDNSVLQFSFIGYNSKEVAVEDQQQIDVVLEETAINLDEVVAVGYGTQKKVNLTGAVSNIEMDDLDNRPITNSSTALQGKVSGVYVLQNSGKPGEDGGNINIRGVGTLNNSDPLVLIDGMPGDMNDVDSRDIESISVLKDASSSAIYGNRAANGVVLVTTKRGSDEKVNITYNGYAGVQEATSLPEVFGSEQYARLYNEAAVNSGQQPRYTEEEIDKFASGDDPMYPDIDYFDVYYDPANIQKHHFNVSGGAENLHYSFMLGYLDQDGILVGTSYDKVDFRSNFDAFFLNDERLRLSARLSGNRGTRKEPQDEWGAKWYATTAPVWPLKNEDDQWIAVAGEQNHYGEIQEGSTSRIVRNKFSSQFEGEFEIVDGLSAEATYGFNLVEANTNTFNANVTLFTRDGIEKDLPSDLLEQNDHEIQSLFNSVLRFEKEIGIHEINLLAGYSEEEFEGSWTNGYRRNFANNTQRILSLGDPSTMENDAGAWDLGLQSMFGRVNYVLDQRYLMEANVRRDGSSRFGEDHKWGTFPSFSLGWILSEEEFMPTLDWLNSLKFRGSWGRLGNQEINSYYAASDILYTGHNYSLGGDLNSGVAVTSMTNKETSWETSEQTNFGIDATIFNTWSFNMEYFQKQTSDILMQVPIPLTMGDLDPPYSNVGAVDNYGWEFSSTYRKTFSDDFKFSGTLNLSRITNEITDLDGRSPIIGVNGEQTAWVEGEAINSFYGYEVDGIYQISDFTWQNESDTDIPHDERDYSLKEGVVSVQNYTAQPGDLKYKDLNGDDEVTMEDDRTVIGDQFPDLNYSLQLNASWKQFDASMFFQGVQGIDGYTYYEIATPFSGTANTGQWWEDRWTPDNPTNEMPRLTLDAFRNHIHSEFYMEDASYLRLKNAELGYTLNDVLTSQIGLNSVRLYANVQNAFTITKFKGFDPEQPTGELRAHAYPQVRIFTMGVNVNF